MDPRNGNRTVHVLFSISLLGKAVDGLLEVVGGVALLFVNPGQVSAMIRALTQHELSEDPHDIVAGLLVRSVSHLSSDTQLFAALFLLSHGVIKIVLVQALLRRRLRAYPVAIAAFGLFLAYQVYRYSHTGSAWLLALSGVDLLVIVLTWLEYRRLRSSGLSDA